MSNYTHSHELASTNSTWELQARKAATSRAWRTSPLRLLRSALVSMVRCCRVTATQPVLEEDMDKKKKGPAGSFLIEIRCVAAESSTEVLEFSFTNSPLVVHALCSSLAKTAITISAIKSPKCLKSLNRIRFDAVDLEHCFSRMWESTVSLRASIKKKKKSCVKVWRTFYAQCEARSASKTFAAATTQVEQCLKAGAKRLRC